mmetsp:Transcript_71671/g.142229  ORF Transcript_71671/g.142229 Transcript_71671/m.142229 type:complete len:98 (-) Transcript_71671:6-299(-)
MNGQQSSGVWHGQYSALALSTTKQQQLWDRKPARGPLRPKGLASLHACAASERMNSASAVGVELTALRALVLHVGQGRINQCQLQRHSPACGVPKNL